MSVITHDVLADIRIRLARFESPKSIAASLGVTVSAIHKALTRARLRATADCPCRTAPNREAAMVTIRTGTPEHHGRDGVWCDPCIADIIRALNDGGVTTIASCCGHGQRAGRISLTDGRELILEAGATA